MDLEKINPAFLNSKLSSIRAIRIVYLKYYNIQLCPLLFTRLRKVPDAVPSRDLWKSYELEVFFETSNTLHEF